MNSKVKNEMPRGRTSLRSGGSHCRPSSAFVPVAIVLSALCFGGAHFSPTALLPLAGGGAVLAYVYYRTGALTASMIAHAGFNLFSIIGLVAFKFT